METTKSQQQQLMASSKKTKGKASFWKRIKHVANHAFHKTSPRNKNEVDEKLKLAFRHLHLEFSRKEQRLEKRIQAIQQEHEALLLQRKKRLWWFVPLGLAIAFAGGYMLFVLTNMQNSMASMTGNIQAMNSHMENMSSDTQNMSQNMQTMNSSMANMNYNVGNMTNSVVPMGEAAKTTLPFMKAAKSFMPF